MWRDRWFAVGVIGAALSCLVCLTALAGLALGAVGLGAWTGHLDTIVVAVLAVFAGLAPYRYRIACRRAP